VRFSCAASLLSSRAVLSCWFTLRLCLLGTFGLCSAVPPSPGLPGRGYDETKLLHVCCTACVSWRSSTLPIAYFGHDAGVVAAYESFAAAPCTRSDRSAGNLQLAVAIYLMRRNNSLAGRHEDWAQRRHLCFRLTGLSTGAAADCIVDRTAALAYCPAWCCVEIELPRVLLNDPWTASAQAHRPKLTQSSPDQRHIQ
jgi:hypothetical protein